MEAMLDSVMNASPYSAWLVFAAVPVLTYMCQQNHPDREKDRLSQENKVYHASCHCRAVSFEVVAPKHLVAWDCNCSICYMKKNWHFIVPYSHLKLAPGSEEYLTEYKFNTKTAKHKFCKQCGVQAFYIPRSNPDGAAITLACVPENEVNLFPAYSHISTYFSLSYYYFLLFVQLVSYEIRKYDGQNWEQFYGKSNISKFSKEK